jgi:hypothetical protein
VGGINIDMAYLAKSMILDKLVANQALTMEIVTEDNLQDIVNAGIEKMDNRFNITFYTGKGLKQMFDQNMNEEEEQMAAYLKSCDDIFLFENGYKAKINIDRIVRIL